MASKSKGHIVQVNAMSDITAARYFVTTLEDAESSRQQLPVAEVRRTVARHIGTVPGTLENIRKLRTKVVPNWLMARLRAAFVAELQLEIQRLEHEISVHLQIGTDPRSDDLAAAKAQVEAARSLLEGRAA